MAIVVGNKSGLTFYGQALLPHQFIVEHLTAKYRVKTAGRGRIINE